MNSSELDNKIVIYQTADGKTQLDVKLENETVWLTQAQMAELFNSSKANVSEHIKHIYQDGELDENSTVRKFRTVRLEGSRQVARNVTYYNLDLIISLGYRVNTKRGIQFRQWATNVLKNYLVKGYAINQRIREMWFMNENGILYDGMHNKRIDDATLVALTLLIAESRPDFAFMTAWPRRATAGRWQRRGASRLCRQTRRHCGSGPTLRGRASATAKA